VIITAAAEKTGPEVVEAQPPVPKENKIEAKGEKES
jgi:hypothetical protein